MIRLKSDQIRVDILGMANAAIDTSELEYLKSCRDKLQDIAAVLNIRERQEQKDQNKKETLSEEKLKEIEKIIKS